jgi:hypothetical protein
MQIELENSKEDVMVLLSLLFIIFILGFFMLPALLLMLAGIINFQ